MRQQVARLNGIDIAYAVAGQGPPVVLIHGLACGQRMWLHQVRALREAFTVVTYDQRGHGASAAPESPSDYSPAHLTRDLAALLDHLSLDRCHLVGFSLGGGPALGVALSQPARIASLTLADVGAGSDDVTLIPSLVRRWTSLARSGGMPALADEMLRAELFRAFVSRRTRDRCYMRGLIEATPLRGLTFTLSEVLGKRRSILRMTAALRRVAMPTLVIRGEQDNICRAAAKVLLGAIPRSTSCVIRGAGHMAPIEAPQAFSAAVRSFAEKHA